MRYVKDFVRRFLLIAVCLVQMAVTGLPAERSLADTLKTVEDRYNRAKTLEVSFQEIYSAPGRGRQSEAGVLYLRKPGRMRWQYTAPEGKLFVGDGKFFYLYSPSANRVQKSKAKETEDMRAPLAFLLGKLDFQRDFGRFETKAEGADLWVGADPRSKELPYTRVEFVVTPAAVIRRVKVTGQDHSILDFSFSAEKMNPPLDEKLFRFQTPPGAQLVEAVE